MRIIKNLIRGIINFFREKDKKVLVIFLLVLAEVVILYFRGVGIEREIGRKRDNYPLAFADILTVAAYGLLFKLIKANIERKFKKIYLFITQKASAPYLAGFMLLIVIAVIFSMTRWKFLTLHLSNIAYFMLITGVFLEFIDVIKESRNPEIVEANKE